MRFELSNHLGNVLVTISDKKLKHVSEDHYYPDVITFTDYYAFGMAMPNRTGYIGLNSSLEPEPKFATGGENHRYAFNGKEADRNEWNTGTVYDYGFRIYDPRICKFLSVDPLTKKYPMLTPYQFASNKPIWAIDLDGLEACETSTETTVEKDCEGRPITRTTHYVTVDIAVKDQRSANNKLLPIAIGNQTPTNYSAQDYAKEIETDAENHFTAEVQNPDNPLQITNYVYDFNVKVVDDADNSPVSLTLLDRAMFDGEYQDGFTKARKGGIFSTRYNRIYMSAENIFGEKKLVSDIKGSTIHELGHYLGLLHPNDKKANIDVNQNSGFFPYNINNLNKSIKAYEKLHYSASKVNFMYQNVSTDIELEVMTATQMEAIIQVIIFDTR